MVFKPEGGVHSSDLGIVIVLCTIRKLDLIVGSLSGVGESSARVASSELAKIIKINH
jgi:hypothetical protein